MEVIGRWRELNIIGAVCDATYRKFVGCRIIIEGNCRSELDIQTIKRNALRGVRIVQSRIECDGEDACHRISR